MGEQLHVEVFSGPRELGKRYQGCCNCLYSSPIYVGCIMLGEKEEEGTMCKGMCKGNEISQTPMILPRVVPQRLSCPVSSHAEIQRIQKALIPP